MSVLQYFKNTPGRPHRATGPKCNFFSSNSQRGPWRKKRGACRPLGGRQGPLPFYKPWPPFPLSFEPKNSGKKLECLPCCHIFLK